MVHQTAYYNELTREVVVNSDDNGTHIKYAVKYHGLDEKDGEKWQQTAKFIFAVHGVSGGCIRAELNSEGQYLECGKLVKVTIHIDGMGTLCLHGRLVSCELVEGQYDRSCFPYRCNHH